MNRNATDILIAGGGVAGLTAAAAFGVAGFSVTVIDPATPITTNADPSADLRTTAFLQPAQAFLDRAGLWDRLAPHATPLQVMRIADMAANPAVIRDFDAADISDKPFGWNLPNWLLRREMVARLAELPNVAFHTGVGFARAVARLDAVLVALSDGSQYAAQLLIGADGRNSAVRQQAGIDVKTRRYGQKAITFAVTHADPHDNISTEVHRDGGPFTLVPLPDLQGKPCSAVVWMLDGAAAQALMALDDTAFAAAATERSGGVYGALTLASRRGIWPIISQVASRLVAQRTALVAEAAHVMPPIGAQGLNMSLADMACLLDLAQADPAGLGSTAMLEAYQRARHGDIRMRVAGIDALNRASIASHPFLQELRATGIKTLFGAAPVRRGLMQMGLGAKR